MRVLLVEDNQFVATAIMRGLGAAHLAVSHVGSGEHAKIALATEHFDIAIIDIGLPGVDGLSLLRGLRADGISIPALILTARHSLADKVKAFDLGADDFLIKPFETEELTARCRALIRRANAATDGLVTLSRLSANLFTRQLKIDAMEIDLTAREWTVLECLIRQIGQIVSKERLLQEMANWEHDISANAVEVYVSRLRNKLQNAAVIRGIRGLGYRLEEPKC